MTRTLPSLSVFPVRSHFLLTEEFGHQHGNLPRIIFSFFVATDMKSFVITPRSDLVDFWRCWAG